MDESTPACCLNCAAELHGAFCAHCGQSAATERLRLRSVLADAASHLFSLDSKAWNTVRGLSLRPGEMCREYIAGQRMPYLPPIRYFLGVLAMVLIVNLLLGFDPAAEMQSTDFTERQQQFQQISANFVKKHLDLALLALVPAYAWLIRRLFRRSGHTYAEVAAFVLFTTGHLMLVTLPLALFRETSVGPVLAVKLLSQVAYLTWAAKAFFEVSTGVAVFKSILATVLYHLLLVGVLTIATLVTVVAQLPTSP